ncbi:MAG: FxsA family protein, partial [Paracoccaceae bacterium]
MWLLVALLGWPLMEIGLFVVIGGQIGLWATLAWVVLSAMLGVLALRIIAVRQALALRDGLR